jgi:hypothetical protein
MQGMQRRPGPSYDQSQELQVRPIEVEESLKRHVCENEGGKQVEMDARFPGRVAQEFEVQAGRSELWRCHDCGMQAGIRCLGRRKGSVRVLHNMDKFVL